MAEGPSLSSPRQGRTRHGPTEKRRETQNRKVRTRTQTKNNNCNLIKYIRIDTQRKERHLRTILLKETIHDTLTDTEKTRKRYAHTKHGEK